MHQTECHECGNLVNFNPTTGVYRCDACGEEGLACAECIWAAININQCVKCRLTNSNFKLEEAGRVA